MKRKFLCFLVALSMLFASVTAFAEAGMSNFQQSENDAEFSDVTKDDWFYDSVQACVRYSLVRGTSETTFSPYDYISVAEAVAFSVRIYDTYYGSENDFSTDGVWYEKYISYAIEKGIISEEDFTQNELLKPADRQTVAYILVNSLPFGEFKVINTEISSLPDVDSSNKYYNEIMMLYKAGVISGKDEYGSFHPSEYITRAETASILCRIADADSRVEFTLKTEDSKPDSFDAVKISAKASPAVFYIEISNKNGKAIASGSGFFISEDGLAVTNQHVIEDAYYAKIRTVDGNEYNVSGIYGASEENDVALLQIDGSGFSYLEIGDYKLQNGQKIYCVGSPLGLENTISEGIVSNASREIDGSEYIQISAPISSGSSGGAVIDTNCRVVGISSGGFEQGQNLNLARPISVINSIDTNGYVSLFEFQTGIPQGTNEGSQESLPSNSGTEGIKQVYPETSVPTYEYVTGQRVISSTTYDDVTFYTYRYNMFALRQYTAYLDRLGYVLYDAKTDGSMNITYYYYSKTDIVAITQSIIYNEIWIAAMSL